MGHARDINPFYNLPPSRARTILAGGRVSYADRRVITPYHDPAGDLCYRLFEEHGWVWGGEIWENARDTTSILNTKVNFIADDLKNQSGDSYAISFQNQ